MPQNNVHHTAHITALNKQIQIFPSIHHLKNGQQLTCNFKQTSSHSLVTVKCANMKQSLTNTVLVMPPMHLHRQQWKD